ncbi:hypothetical protein [Aphanothece stagnina]|uniref:hypothetical protein n=1 Tax=Aphanothece stagnina TaxID=1004305 RepID=UPI00398F3345
MGVLVPEDLLVAALAARDDALGLITLGAAVAELHDLPEAHGRGEGEGELAACAAEKGFAGEGDALAVEQDAEMLAAQPTAFGLGPEGENERGYIDRDLEDEVDWLHGPRPATGRKLYS